ncbi:MAG: methyltransferase [Theionarchaea archaeon]|nr:methyltransferase [Theionarchaea archaeon]
MSSRERVLASLNHEEPDRVPVDLGATPSSGISAIAYHNLKSELRIAGNTRVYDVVQQLAQPEESILDLFKIDVVDVGRAFNVGNRDWYRVVLPDGTPCQFPSWFRPLRGSDGIWRVEGPEGDIIAIMPHGGTFFEQTLFPYTKSYPEDHVDLKDDMNKVHWSALAHSPWDHAKDPGFWNALREKTRELGRVSDRALVISVGCNLFEWGTFLRRMDNFVRDLTMRPGDVDRLLDALMELHMEFLERVCRTVGDLVDVVRFGDDLGSNQGPLISPRLYRRYFKERHGELCRYVRDNSQMHTFLHSCGSVYELLPDIIEAGFEIVNPVQINARGMDPERLKSKFGDRVTFWGGGCDTRNVLNRSDPSWVGDHVRHLVQTLSAGGGFVFTTVHNILPDVPPRNLLAMYGALEGKGYPWRRSDG